MKKSRGGTMTYFNSNLSFEEKARELRAMGNFVAAEGYELASDIESVFEENLDQNEKDSELMEEREYFKTELLQQIKEFIDSKSFKSEETKELIKRIQSMVEL